MPSSSTSVSVQDSDISNKQIELDEAWAEVRAIENFKKCVKFA